MKMKKLLLPFAFFAVSLGYTATASATMCSPNVAQKVLNSADQAAKRSGDIAKQTNDKLGQGLENQMDLFGCTDIWPSGDFGFKLPSIGDILKDMGEAAMNKACNLARDKVREQTNKINQSIRLDTSMIDGFDELGLGNYELGSASTSGRTGGTPDFTMKNNSKSSGSSDWNAISDAINKLK